MLDGYKSVYTNKLESILGKDIHFWYGTKEAFVAKPDVQLVDNISLEFRALGADESKIEYDFGDYGVHRSGLLKFHMKVLKMLN